MNKMYSAPSGCGPEPHPEGAEYTRPIVSVVMAAKNYARFLPQAVESVFAQTFTAWELVVIDDGSTDQTPKAVKPFLSDPRVRYHRSDKLGQPRAKNLGMRLSRGEFVAYLDADDAWEPTKLEKQLAVLRANPRVGVCHCERLLMDEGGNLLSPPPLRGRSASEASRVGGGSNDPPPATTYGRDDLPRKGGGEESDPLTPNPSPAGGEGSLRQLFLRNSVCFSSVVVRRAVFDHVGGFDPEFDLAIDYDLWLRVARHYEFANVDEPLVLYRTGHGNLSKKLWDRVDTALAIMTRAVRRSGSELPPAVVAEGYSSTCNTLGYVMRPSEPTAAARWYLRGLASGGRTVESVKGLAACALRWLSGKRTPSTAENATANG